MFFFSNQKDKIKCECSKTKFLHYFILSFLCIINIIALNFCFLISENIEAKSSLSIVLFDLLLTKEGFEIILITIIDKLMIKYEYFIHRYISIVLFLIFCVSLDLLLDNYSLLSNKKFLEISLNIISILTGISYSLIFK